MQGDRRVGRDSALGRGSAVSGVPQSPKMLQEAQNTAVEI